MSTVLTRAQKTLAAHREAQRICQEEKEREQREAADRKRVQMINTVIESISPSLREELTRDGWRFEYPPESAGVAFRRSVVKIRTPGSSETREDPRDIVIWLPSGIDPEWLVRNCGGDFSETVHTDDIDLPILRAIAAGHERYMQQQVINENHRRQQEAEAAQKAAEEAERKRVSDELFANVVAPAIEAVRSSLFTWPKGKRLRYYTVTYQKGMTNEGDGPEPDYAVVDCIKPPELVRDGLFYGLDRPAQAPLFVPAAALSHYEPRVASNLDELPRHWMKPVSFKTPGVAKNGAYWEPSEDGCDEEQWLYSADGISVYQPVARLTNPELYE